MRVLLRIVVPESQAQKRQSAKCLTNSRKLETKVCLNRCQRKNVLLSENLSDHIPEENFYFAYNDQKVLSAKNKKQKR